MAPDRVRQLGALLFWTTDQRFITHIGLNRSACHGPFTPAERELLLQFHPHLSQAIHRVQLFESQQAITQMLQQALDHPMKGLILMNSKEQVVFHNHAAKFRSTKLAADGLRNEDIASHLGICINTVRAHLRSVFDKSNIHHRGELVSHFK